MENLSKKDLYNINARMVEILINQISLDKTLTQEQIDLIETKIETIIDNGFDLV